MFHHSSSNLSSSWILYRQWLFRGVETSSNCKVSWVLAKDTRVFNRMRRPQEDLPVQMLGVIWTQQGREVQWLALNCPQLEAVDLICQEVGVENQLEPIDKAKKDSIHGRTRCQVYPRYRKKRARRKALKIWQDKRNMRWKRSARILKVAVEDRRPKSIVKEVRNPAMRCARNTVIVLWWALDNTQTSKKKRIQNLQISQKIRPISPVHPRMTPLIASWNRSTKVMRWVMKKRKVIWRRNPQRQDLCLYNLRTLWLKTRQKRPLFSQIKRWVQKFRQIKTLQKWIPLKSMWILCLLLKLFWKKNQKVGLLLTQVAVNLAE